MPVYGVCARTFPSRTCFSRQFMAWSVAFIKKYKANFVTGPKEEPLTTECTHR